MNVSVRPREVVAEEPVSGFFAVLASPRGDCHTVPVLAWGLDTGHRIASVSVDGGRLGEVEDLDDWRIVQLFKPAISDPRPCSARTEEG